MADKPTFLPVDFLQPNPLQPRGVITAESLADLVDSIKIHGVIEPLVVAHTPAGYQIIAGERRWRASKLAGLKEVPVLIKETTPQGMLEMAIVENVQRSDLNPIDRAKAFDRLMSEFTLANSEIAQRIGKSPAYISNSLKLLELPDALKDGLISGVISEGHARALASIGDIPTMIEAYKIILRENGSVRRAEDLARRMKKRTDRKNSKLNQGLQAKTINEQIDLMAKSLQQSLGDNAAVKMRRSRVETAVQIVFKGNPEQTEAQLERLYRLLTNEPGVKLEAAPETQPQEPDPSPFATDPVPSAPESSSPFFELTQASEDDI